ncbi:MAG: dihydrolipoyllysine-residue acetyltransferase [Litorivicinaceae bacterium]|nr:dihydrolipoyllysine-residue acetyltransferase [Litorivicinaceae bacterium]
MTTICVPDIGGASGVTVIEVAVQPGDSVAVGDTLIVLESDKASMEIPAEQAGVIGVLHVREGSQVNEGDPICEMAPAAEVPPAPANQAPVAAPTDTPQPALLAASSAPSARESIVVPDTGSADGITVIEVAVAVGDLVAEGDTLIVLESDKASMEIPSPRAGLVKSLAIKEGDSVKQGDPIAELETAAGAGLSASAPIAAPAVAAPVTPAVPAASIEPAPARASDIVADATVTTSGVHAGPAVRALARELGLDLARVAGTGPRSRITKDDLHQFVKQALSQATAAAPVVASGAGIPAITLPDFAAFGPIERIKMSKIHILTADNMTRCLLNVPAVTQFDEADITELEEFRKSMKADADRLGVKLTPMPFLIKAAAYALRALPQVNASIDPVALEIIRKGYVHIGIAVDTPDGLMVPVIRDADQKGLWDIARETVELAEKAKTKKLKPAEMQGASFTISSLGSIGGTAFTPIVPSPQAAILGVSKASIKPVWDGKAFLPRMMLPLSLSYDHRVINGGDGARFTSVMSQVLGDIRRLLL